MAISICAFVKSVYFKVSSFCLLSFFFFQSQTQSDGYWRSSSNFSVLWYCPPGVLTLCSLPLRSADRHSRAAFSFLQSFSCRKYYLKLKFIIDFKPLLTKEYIKQNFEGLSTFSFKLKPRN